MKEFVIVILCINAVLLLVALIFQGGWEAMEKEAVRQGHAEYYFDKDHNKQWRWRPVSECGRIPPGLADR